MIRKILLKLVSYKKYSSKCKVGDWVRWIEFCGMPIAWIDKNGGVMIC